MASSDWIKTSSNLGIIASLLIFVGPFMFHQALYIIFSKFITTTTLEELLNRIAFSSIATITCGILMISFGSGILSDARKLEAKIGYLAAVATILFGLGLIIQGISFTIFYEVFDIITEEGFVHYSYLFYRIKMASTMYGIGIIMESIFGYNLWCLYNSLLSPYRPLS